MDALSPLLRMRIGKGRSSAKNVLVVCCATTTRRLHNEPDRLTGHHWVGRKFDFTSAHAKRVPVRNSGLAKICAYDLNKLWQKNRPYRAFLHDCACPPDIALIGNSKRIVVPRSIWLFTTTLPLRTSHSSNTAERPTPRPETDVACSRVLRPDSKRSFDSSSFVSARMPRAFPFAATRPQSTPRPLSDTWKTHIRNKAGFSVIGQAVWPRKSLSWQENLAISELFCPPLSRSQNKLLLSFFELVEEDLVRFSVCVRVIKVQRPTTTVRQMSAYRIRCWLQANSWSESVAVNKTLTSVRRHCVAFKTIE